MTLINHVSVHLLIQQVEMANKLVLIQLFFFKINYEFIALIFTRTNLFHNRTEIFQNEGPSV